jgi:ferredoxin
MIDAGKTLEQIQSECGAGLGCGSCLKMLNDELNQNEMELKNNPEKLEGLKLSEAEKLVPQSVLLRVCFPGQAFTMDFNPDRLNLIVDKDGVVVKANWS